MQRCAASSLHHGGGTYHHQHQHHQRPACSTTRQPVAAATRQRLARPAPPSVLSASSRPARAPRPAAAAAGGADAPETSSSSSSRPPPVWQQQQQHEEDDDADDLTADDNIILLGSEDEDGDDEELQLFSSSTAAGAESAADFAAAMAAARERVLSGSSDDDDGAADDDGWDTRASDDEEFWSTERERVYLVGVTYKQQYQQALQQRQRQQRQQARNLFQKGSSSSSSGPQGGLGMSLSAAAADVDTGMTSRDGTGGSSSGIGARRRRAEVAYSVEESLEELGRLAETAGLQVVGSSYQALEAPNNSTYIGSGKVAEVAAAVAAFKADTVVFDDELSPGQLRNLEKALAGGPNGRPVAVADRTALILDIFSQRARTREGKLQVELAQVEYQLPRLSRMWTHLDRVAGGGQVKGVGEKQIEIDKRLLRDKAAALRRELEAVRTHRAAHRTRRQDAPIPVVALVGYTNAGKSTLLNTLTAAGVLAEDKLFATLDPTTRKVRLEGNLEVLMSDTVGFIQKLPTQLVAAFRATLEEIAAASVVVHVLDVSAPNAAAQCSAVLQVLEELGVQDLPMITAWNKADACPDPEAVLALAASRPDVVAVSSATGLGLQRLLDLVATKLQENMVDMQVLLPYSQGALLDELHTAGKVLDVAYTEAGTQLTASVPRHMVGRLRQYATGDSSSSSSTQEPAAEPAEDPWPSQQRQHQLAGHQLPPDWAQLVAARSLSSV